MEGCFLLAIICVIVIVIVIVFSLAIIYVIGDKKIDQKKMEGEQRGRHGHWGGAGLYGGQSKC